MPPFLDCYVLVESRSRELVHRFLNEFLPHRRERPCEYQLPQLSSGPHVVVYTSGDDLLSALEKRGTEPYVLYWSNPEPGLPRRAIVAPTNDGRTVFGLSVEEDQDEPAASFIKRMKIFFGAGCLGYFAFEHPPPESTQEFLENAQSDGAKIP